MTTPNRLCGGRAAGAMARRAVQSGRGRCGRRDDGQPDETPAGRRARRSRPGSATRSRARARHSAWAAQAESRARYIVRSVGICHRRRRRRRHHRNRHRRHSRQNRRPENDLRNRHRRQARSPAGASPDARSPDAPSSPTAGAIGSSMSGIAPWRAKTPGAAIERFGRKGHASCRAGPLPPAQRGASCARPAAVPPLHDVRRPGRSAALGSRSALAMALRWS